MRDAPAKADSIGMIRYRDDEKIFFQGVTNVHQHISTAEGRRQLSRFPVVRVLCDAQQNAGYRAEMDDDGDIWYECDDGDRYFNARAVQPPRGDGGQDHDDECSASYCKICQDLEWYGLWRIREREAEAKHVL